MGTTVAAVDHPPASSGADPVEAVAVSVPSQSALRAALAAVPANADTTIRTRASHSPADYTTHTEFWPKGSG
ncbi:hypothetical protein [Glycomyces artemisiae]|uniref:Uncharacterized protein n=1 Tax=Glycomyces artemisiae TaxID=1076443 RepID=A0A2T0UH36_9ACTN|nr:hypothetical protein [Glycomyces artemisiae]PRY57261.1 hypothetical protein B0I28_107109 [Glycomyces artemisiae]